MITCRSGSLKYGWNCSSWDELYDLAEDPHELHNRIDDPAYAQRAEAMRSRVEAFMVESGYPGIALDMFRQSRGASHTK
jgi:hypothetical protein